MLIGSPAAIFWEVRASSSFRSWGVRKVCRIRKALGLRVLESRRRGCKIGVVSLRFSR